ncbi:unnamed protein product [Psylliodes chrysocephalus]|uniref:Uncharacterized protein n=1 Tax=Psylliodes chrysocephalus TaxID=3402493 RepID=A0A9P0CYH4_9CUCU|nr:unnamed protein product [Psylliodes chrysocephala]
MGEIEDNCKKIRAVFPPNAPMEPRNHFSTTPVIYDTLFFVDFNKLGNCILGTSGVAETFWEGTLLYFDNIKQLDNFDYQTYYIYSSNSDGKFINDKTVVLADDTGHINVLSIEVDSSIRTINYFRLSNRVPQIGVWDNSNRILGASDRSISIWECNSVDGKPLKSFDNYHWDTVTCLDTLRNNTNLFVSGARDRLACIWDVRNPVPASVLYNNEFSTITSVAWNQYDDNYLVAGTQAGDIYLLDKREPKDFISVLYCFSAPVNRISFKNSKDFAVCGDSKEVLVINSEGDNLDVVYKNEKHKGHVKGLAWYEDTLYSCGFGKSVINHVF